MKTGIGLLFILCIYTSFAQTPSSGTVIVRAQAPPPVYLRDVFSTPFESKPYAGIQGSPYIGDGWLLAQLKVEGNNERIDSILIKLNIYSNKIHFRNENGEEMQTTLRVEEIKIIDSSSTLLNTTFLSSFEQDAAFFEVLADGGKLKLLRKHRVDIWETKPLGSEVQRRFEPRSELFFSSDRILFHASKNCSTIRDAFRNNEKMFSYISANNIRCNKEEDMRKLIAYYTTLK